jgi:hypothetical protein
MIKYYLKRYGYAAWLGLALGMFANIGIFDIDFWLILVPFYFLLGWRDQ